MVKVDEECRKRPTQIELPPMRRTSDEETPDAPSDVAQDTHEVYSPNQMREALGRSIQVEADRAVEETDKPLSFVAEAAAKDLLHRAGNCAGGLVEGTTGVPGHQEPGYEGEYALCQLGGAAAGAYADVQLVAAGASLAVGGGAACGTGVLCAPGVAVAAGGAAISTTGVALIGAIHGPEAYEALVNLNKWHHLATNKHTTKWTPIFKDIFARAKMELNDKLNLVWVPGHAGPHPAEYHQAVYDRLVAATKGLRGGRYIQALQDELADLAKEAATPGSYLNKMLVK